MNQLEVVTQLNILNTVMSMNIPHYLPKPETSRWNRKHSEVAEWYLRFHTISCPIQEGHYLHHTHNMIEVPKLMLRVAEVG